VRQWQVMKKKFGVLALDVAEEEKVVGQARAMRRFDTASRFQRPATDRAPEGPAVTARHRQS